MKDMKDCTSTVIHIIIDEGIRRISTKHKRNSQNLYQTFYVTKQKSHNSEPILKFCVSNIQIHMENHKSNT